jgi:glycosyltransferase involved in cell wall biosynthesis
MLASLTINKLKEKIQSSFIPDKGCILVVDGGSTDSTLDICKRENVKYILQIGKGKGSAMRKAVEQSVL